MTAAKGVAGEDRVIQVPQDVVYLGSADDYGDLWRPMGFWIALTEYQRRVNGWVSKNGRWGLHRPTNEGQTVLSLTHRASGLCFLHVCNHADASTVVAGIDSAVDVGELEVVVRHGHFVVRPEGEAKEQLRALARYAKAELGAVGFGKPI